MSNQRRILVTGGAGLVGSGVKEALEKRKLEKRELNANDVWFFPSSKELNLTNAEATQKYFKDNNITHVIHLAAMVGGLFNNMKHKLEFYLVNSNMNQNVLAAAYEQKCVKCISCLSTCIFPDYKPEEYPINELMIHNGPPHPSNEGYAYAKRMLDVLNRIYNEKAKEEGLKCVFTSIVPTNVFGKHDNFNIEDGHVLPGLIHKCHKAIKSDGNLTLWGSGTPLRQFIYNRDMGELILLVLESYNDPNPIILSVGEKDEITTEAACKKIMKAMDPNGEIVKLKKDTSKSDGQFKKTASNEKLMKFLQDIQSDFKFTPIDIAIQETVDWFVKNYEIARK